MFFFENAIWRKNELAIGLDEVGRGAFAGPLGIGGVVFNNNIKNIYYKNNSNVIIRDSKKMTELQREKAYKWIIEHALNYHVEFIDVEYINKLNISEATQLGFRKTVNKIYKKNNLINKLLLDAFELKNHDFFTPEKQEAIIKGDSKSFSIAAASIVAKVTRDNYMKKLAKNSKYANYLWHKNKGYGTLEHRNAIKQFGICEHHRKIKQLL